MCPRISFKMRFLYFKFFVLFIFFSSNGFAVCESGSSMERLSCMREAFCPEASTVEERTACYQMITEALRSDRLADDQPNRPSPKKPKAQEVEKSNLESELFLGQEAEVSAGEAKQGSGTDEKDRRQEKRSEDKRDQRKRFELFGWAKSNKKIDYGPEWTRVAFVRRESSGAELVVLEDGQVWGETKRNGFVTLSKGDWVKMRGTSQLVRRGGGTTEVESLNCNKDDLKGRCRGLKKFL